MVWGRERGLGVRAGIGGGGGGGGGGGDRGKSFAGLLNEGVNKH